MAEKRKKGKLIERTITKYLTTDGKAYQKNGKNLLLDEDTTAQLRRIEAIRYLAMGNDVPETATHLSELYGISFNTAQDICYESLANARQLKEIECQTVAKENFNRLETIIKNAYRKNDYKVVIAAIQEQNKIAKVYDTGTNLTISNFEIKLGNDNNTTGT